MGGTDDSSRHASSESSASGAKDHQAGVPTIGELRHTARGDAFENLGLGDDSFAPRHGNSKGCRVHLRPTLDSVQRRMSGASTRISARLALGALIAAAMGFGASTANAQVLLPGVDPGPIPSPNCGSLTQFEGEPVLPPVRVQEPAAAPVHGAERQVEHPRRRLPVRHQHGGRPARPRDRPTPPLRPRVRLDHLRQQGRIVSVCVGLDRPVLSMLDPKTLVPMATLDLPPRPPGVAASPTSPAAATSTSTTATGSSPRPASAMSSSSPRPTSPASASPRTSTSAASSPPTTRSSRPCPTGRAGSGSPRPRARSVGSSQDRQGPQEGAEGAHRQLLRGRREGLRLHGHRRRPLPAQGAKGQGQVLWRRGYPNTGETKPGQTQAGSGTTPTLMAGGRLVAITDNADPMHVMAFRRAVDPQKKRLVCKGACSARAPARPTRA